MITDDMWFRLCTLLHFFFWHPKTGAVVHRRLVHGFLLLPHLIQSFLRAEAAVRMTAREELLHMLFIDREALRLEVGSEGTFLRDRFSFQNHSFIRRNACPVKGLQNILRCACNFPRLIGVFNAKVESASLFLRSEVGKESGAESADV